jgi:hypothetical protein
MKASMHPRPAHATLNNSRKCHSAPQRFFFFGTAMSTLRMVREETFDILKARSTA